MSFGELGQKGILLEGHAGCDLLDDLAEGFGTYALIAGVGYALLFALGIFANFLVREGLIVPGDAAEPAANIGASEDLFRAGLVSFMTIFLIEVVVAWALYMLFKKANESLSLVTAWFRIVYTVFLGVALIFFFQALQLLDRARFLTVFTTEQVNAQALIALDTFNSAWLIGLLAFGVHLALLGALVVRSRMAPRALGFLLVVAGVAYVADTVGQSVLANYADYETFFVVIVATASVAAEGWFGLWLLLRGGKDGRLSP